MDELGVEVVAVRWSDGDFAVVVAVTDEGEEVTVLGALAHVHAGEAVDVAGGWRVHPKHGRQFHAEHVRVREPVSEAAILAYLAAVKHVGPTGARWLVQRWGEEQVLAEVDRDPRTRLREVPGIGPGRIAGAVRSWQAQGEVRAVRLFLESHGVPAAVAARVYRAFGAGAVETLRTDPYALTELDGVGFATADALAQALGTPPDSPGRLDAGVVHALREAERDGHCHLPRPELLRRTRALLGADADDRVDMLAAAGRLVVEEDRVAEAAMDAVERRLARRVRELLAEPPALNIDAPERPEAAAPERPAGEGPESAAAEALERPAAAAPQRPAGEAPERPAREAPERLTAAAPGAAVAGVFVPSDAQWAVVAQVLERRLSILTGGPGVGKTAAMRALVDLLRERKRSVRLCAPTGKAARRLSESTGAPASTVHRLLEYVPGEGFMRDAEDPIPGTDVLIVDEASMLDVRLAGALFDAVGPRTHVLLVGDVDQLAPVGPGRVLEDLIESGEVPSVRLTEIFRQARRSMIIRAAHRINGGEYPPTEPGDGDLHDFFLIGRGDPQAIFDEVVSLAADRLPAHYDLDPVADVQVLVPMHRGPVGIDAFNAELRGRLNADGEPIPGTPFRAGDKVVQTKNNHERELMNGETGVILVADPDEERIVLGTDDGRRIVLGFSELETLRLAYAMSIHKAQGSQARAVVIPLFRGHHVMLTRNLVYTGVTRASELAVLVGQPEALQTALSRRDAHRRYTRLAERVSGER
jgi:exodeoxyribonuclease V alpha subunit